MIGETGPAGKYEAAVEVPRSDPPEDGIDHSVALEGAKLRPTVTRLVVDSAGMKTPKENQSIQPPPSTTSPS